jgi:hypothetical protein
MLLRRGLWGIRTLAFMGYYIQESVREAIGYRASPEGWDVHARELTGPQRGSAGPGPGAEATSTVDTDPGHEGRS